MNSDALNAKYMYITHIIYTTLVWSAVKIMLLIWHKLCKWCEQECKCPALSPCFCYLHLDK